MSKTLSLLSRTQTITALETIPYLLATYPTSLSGYEKECLIKFAILVVENMEKNQAGHITISQYLDSEAARTASRGLRSLSVARTALYSMLPGARARYYSEPSSLTPPHISPDTCQKNIPEQTIQKGDTHLSHECRSDQGSESE